VGKSRHGTSLGICFKIVAVVVICRPRVLFVVCYSSLSHKQCASLASFPLSLVRVSNKIMN